MAKDCRSSKTLGKRILQRLFSHISHKRNKIRHTIPSPPVPVRQERSLRVGVSERSPHSMALKAASTQVLRLHQQVLWHPRHRGESHATPAKQTRITHDIFDEVHSALGRKNPSGTLALQVERLALMPQPEEFVWADSYRKCLTRLKNMIVMHSMPTSKTTEWQ